MAGSIRPNVILVTLICAGKAGGKGSDSWLGRLLEVVGARELEAGVGARPAAKKSARCVSKKSLRRDRFLLESRSRFHVDLFGKSVPTFAPTRPLGCESCFSCVQTRASVVNCLFSRHQNDTSIRGSVPSRREIWVSLYPY